MIFCLVGGLTQGAGIGDFHETGHPGWSCECSCALTPIFMSHLGFKLKNNVKFHNSASYKSPKCIYSFIVSTLDLLEPGLSDETVETVSDLFLFSHPRDHQCLGYYTPFCTNLYFLLQILRPSLPLLK
jgi:hypothetical protein